jgi:hypothetical protein
MGKINKFNLHNLLHQSRGSYHIYLEQTAAKSSGNYCPINHILVHVGEFAVVANFKDKQNTVTSTTKL